MILFGAFLFLFGCGAIVLLIRTDGDEFVRIAIGVVMALFACLGIVLIFGRYRLEIDAKSRTYREGNRLLLFFEKARGSLDEFRTVTVRRHASGGSTTGRRSKTYAIQLLGPMGTLDIGSRSTLSQAHIEAEKVSRALDLPFATHDGE